MLRRHLILPLLGALALIATSAPVASAAPIWAIGDNTPATFANPDFQRLGVKRTRLITPWDSIFEEPDRLDKWMKAASAAGLEPLIAFEHSRDDRCPASPCPLTSVSDFIGAFNAFRAKYPYVRLYHTWNEANSATQPTVRSPSRVAQYFDAMTRACRSCKIIALDVQDLGNAYKYAKDFDRFARTKVKIWGLHNYTDTNRARDSGTPKFLKTVKTGEVWLTETGGLYELKRVSGPQNFPPDEARQRRSFAFLVKQVRKYQKAKRGQLAIKRVYIYQWAKNNANDRFDSGIVAFDGSKRAAYNVIFGIRKYFR